MKTEDIRRYQEASRLPFDKGQLVFVNSRFNNRAVITEVQRWYGLVEVRFIEGRLINQTTAVSPGDVFPVPE
jgi:hypothetical protein